MERKGDNFKFNSNLQFSFSYTREWVRESPE